MSPALAGGFLTTPPPGKSQNLFNFNGIEKQIILGPQVSRLSSCTAVKRKMEVYNTYARETYYHFINFEV